MSDSANSTTRSRRRSYRLGTLAIVLLALAMGTVVQAAGWAQTSNYALIRALAGGTAQIDKYSWESRDSAYYDGHFYSVKAPGMALLALPVYGALKAAGAERASADFAANARAGGALRWYRAGVSSDQYAGKIKLARETRSKIENYTPLVWMLGLFVVVIPALILMLMVRALGDQLAPRFGVLAAVIAGAGTMLLPFSTMLFSHVLAAAIALGVFALLWRERAGPPRLGLVALAGLLAGFAVTTEYPLALAGAALGGYAISRSRADWLRRGLVYSAGAIAGVLPLLAYNVFAFGSITHFSYADAIAVQGISGHDKLGLNSGGFFGIGTPTFQNAFDLLFSVKGLFVATPVLALGLVGIVLMARQGRRAEAFTIAGIFAAYVVYNAGYWLPFGGGTPGPRFLIPSIPFLAVALAPALRRFTATGLALAIPSVLTMAAATATLPMIGNGDVGLWVDLVRIGNFEQTIASFFGADNGWWGILPFVLLLGSALIAVVCACVPLRLSRDLPIAAGAMAAWAAAVTLTTHSPATVTPGPAHDFSALAWTSVFAAIVLVGGGALSTRLITARRRGRIGEAASAAT